MERKVRVGIIGAGYWAAYFYLPLLMQDPDAYCVGVVRRNTVALEGLQRHFELEVATTEVDELLDAGCDAVIVASAHSAHREHVEKALRAGCHVLDEKPMTVSLKDAHALANLAAQSEKLLTIAYGWNYNIMAAWAVDLLRSGELGEVRSIAGNMASSLVPLYSGRGGYGKISVGGFEIEAASETYTIAEAGGGYIYGQISHLLGLGLSLIDSPPSQVFATANRLENGIDIDDSLTVQFVNGAVGSFFGSGRFPWGVRYPFDLQVVTEKGIVLLDFAREKAEAYLYGKNDRELYRLENGQQAFTGRQPDYALRVAPGVGLYSCEGPVRHLLRHCLGRRTEERAGTGLGVRTVAVMESATHSARIGAPVSITGI